MQMEPTRSNDRAHDRRRNVKHEVGTPKELLDTEHVGGNGAESGQDCSSGRLIHDSLAWVVVVHAAKTSGKGPLSTHFGALDPHLDAGS